jgi:hypothetical protein
MIDIIGNVRIADDKRFAYLIYCIRSYAFIKDNCRFILSVENISNAQMSILKRELMPYNYTIIRGLSKSYGENYCQLIKEGTNDHIINFMEDQFMILNDSTWLMQLLKCMKINNVDVCKASFFTIEQNSIKLINGERNTFGLIFYNNESNYYLYKKHYKNRYYLGVNFITTRDFALKFWNRTLGSKPHPYEISGYNQEFHHKCIIPSKEIQAAIDDNHGEAGTCLLERNEQKYDSVISY